MQDVGDGRDVVEDFADVASVARRARLRLEEHQVGQRRQGPLDATRENSLSAQQRSREEVRVGQGSSCARQQAQRTVRRGQPPDEVKVEGDLGRQGWREERPVAALSADDVRTLTRHYISSGRSDSHLPLPELVIPRPLFGTAVGGQWYAGITASARRAPTAPSSRCGHW
jgi:hypothetical protein